MSLRYEFVLLALKADVNMAQLCRRFGISRKTGYKWRKRFVAAGPPALQDRSRRPHHSPKRTALQLQTQALKLRRQRHWGARKIHQRLCTLGYSPVPAPSTLNGILKRSALIDPGESAQRQPPRRFERSRPNELWQMDFKGHFATGCGRCHPLTVLDDHSRYSMTLRACANERASTVKHALTSTFRRYGLPQQMLMDNGPPWGYDADHVLTGLTLWLIRLGIRVSHGRPYHPQTQGKEERFHRSLNVEVIRGQLFTDLAHCQRRFDRWRNIYNLERPHEALGMQVPAQRYQPSLHAFSEHLPPIQYAAADQVRRVCDSGTLSFQSHRFRISTALSGYWVALRPTVAQSRWEVFFCHQRVATIDLDQRNA